MKSIMIKELKLIRKGKGNFFFLFLMPILFIVLFGSVLGNVGSSTYTIQAVDQDQSPASKAFLNQLGEIKGFEVKQSDAADLESEIDKVKAGKLTSLVVIPKEFGQAMQSGEGQATLSLYRDAASDTAVAPIQAVLNSIVAEYQKQKVTATLQGMGQSEAQVKQILQAPIQVQEIKESVNSDGSISMIEQVVPGYTVMFTFFIIMTMTQNFLGEKESGMLSRLRSTPMNPMSYLIGMWIPAILTVLIQNAVLLGFGHFVYGLHLGNLLAVVALCICLAVCGTGIGLAISLLIKGGNQGRGITMLITMGGAALGGLWFPTELMPHFAQVIGQFTPQYWAQHGLQDVMIRGAEIGDVWKSIAVLLAFGVAGLMVALMRFNRFLKSATN